VVFLIVEVKGQCSFKFMVLCMENFMEFRHHFLDPSNNFMQVNYMRPSSAFGFNLKGPQSRSTDGLSLSEIFIIFHIFKFMNVLYGQRYSVVLYRIMRYSKPQKQYLSEFCLTVIKTLLSH